MVKLTNKFLMKMTKFRMKKNARYAYTELKQLPLPPVATCSVGIASLSAAQERHCVLYAAKTRLCGN